MRRQDEFTSGVEVRAAYLESHVGFLSEFPQRAHGNMAEMKSAQWS
jgi:hypothetical protein